MGEGFKWYDVHLIVCLSVANCAYVTLVYENCQKIPTSVKIPDNVKIVMSAYLSDKWSDYDEIWYTSSDSDSDKNDLTTIQILKFNTADGRHIENIGRGLSDFLRTTVWRYQIREYWSKFRNPRWRTIENRYIAILKWNATRFWQTPCCKFW